MPFPKPDAPFYCTGSGGPLPDDHDRDALWHRCGVCGRLIAEAGKRGVFHAHRNIPGRRNDKVQEALHALGMNNKQRWGDEATVCADQESDT